MLAGTHMPLAARTQVSVGLRQSVGSSRKAPSPPVRSNVLSEKCVAS